MPFVPVPRSPDVIQIYPGYARHSRWSLETGLRAALHSIAVLAALAASLLAAGCRPPEEPSSDLSVTWEVQPDPPRTGATTVTVILADSSGAPISDADVDLEATMTHPGMQPVFAEALEIAPGRYEASLDLTMGGDWVLLLEGTLSDGRIVRSQMDLRAVRAQ